MADLVERVAKAIGLRRMYAGELGKQIASYAPSEVLACFERLWVGDDSLEGDYQRDSYHADARAAIAEVLDWLDNPPKRVWPLLSAAQIDVSREYRSTGREWHAMMAVMRKEALGE